jgi:hypothetical protein
MGAKYMWANREKIQGKERSDRAEGGRRGTTEIG